MTLLQGKRLLITGVLSQASLAYRVAEHAQLAGAEIVLTSLGNAMKHTKKAAANLPTEPDVLELDITDSDHIETLRVALADKWGTLDGALHSIGYAPAVCLGGTFMDAGADDVATAVNVSAYSLKALADLVVPLMPDGGSIVGLDFDATVTWPAYDWMGVAKAALESTNRYLARYLGPQGIRCNLIAAGPTRTIAARSIPGFAEFEDVWEHRAPLGWDIRDTTPVAKACTALFSDLFPKTTGSIIYVDGGVHSTGG